MALVKSKWLTTSANGGASLDGLNVTTNLNTIFNLGVAYIAGVKGLLRRSITAWNVNTVPAVGPAVNFAVAVPVNAYLEGTCTGRTVGSNNPSTASTITRIRDGRNSWVNSQATWTDYKTGNAWGTGGASNPTTDIDAATPTAVAITFPAAAGAFTWTGLTGFVTDAVANRSGLVDCHFKLDNEGTLTGGDVPANDRIMALSLSDFYLVVEYYINDSRYFFL